MLLSLCILNILFFHVLVISFVREKCTFIWRFFCRWIIFSIGPYNFCCTWYFSVFQISSDACNGLWIHCFRLDVFFVLGSGFAVIHGNSQIWSLSIAPPPIFYVHLLENLLGICRNLLPYPLLHNVFLIYPIY